MVLIVSGKKTPEGLLLVITDQEILGKIYEEGKLQLDLTQKFYQGEEKSKKEIKLLLSKSRHLHLTGKEAVALGVEFGLVNPNKILYISQVPHAEVIIEH